MTTLTRPDFFIHRAAPPKSDKHRSSQLNRKAAYRPRLQTGKQVNTFAIEAMAELIDPGGNVLTASIADDAASWPDELRRSAGSTRKW